MFVFERAALLWKGVIDNTLAHTEKHTSGVQGGSMNEWQA